MRSSIFAEQSIDMCALQYPRLHYLCPEQFLLSLFRVAAAQLSRRPMHLLHYTKLPELRVCPSVRIMPAWIYL